MGHPRQRKRRRTCPLRLPIPRPRRLPRHHRRPLPYVQKGILELRQTHQRHPPPRHAHPQRGRTYRQTQLRRRQHQHMVQRCGSRPQTLHQRRYRNRRNLPRLRSQNHLYRRLQKLPQLRLVQVLVTKLRNFLNTFDIRKSPVAHRAFFIVSNSPGSTVLRSRYTTSKIVLHFSIAIQLHTKCHPKALRLGGIIVSTKALSSFRENCLQPIAFYNKRGSALDGHSLLCYIRWADG